MNQQGRQNQGRGGQPARQIEWQAPEYPKYKKHPLWFLGFGIVVGLIILYGVLDGSWTTVVAFGLFGIVGAFHASRTPRTITIRMNGGGVEIDAQPYTFDVIKKFWIHFAPPETKALYLETTASINNTLRVELANQDPNQVREFLLKFVDEDLDRRESLVDAIARHLRF